MDHFFDRWLMTNLCVGLNALSVRCMHPAQQHGRRFPCLSSETTLVTCSRLVSGLFTEVVQQIHSLRASGVMSSHAANDFASEDKASRMSDGIACTVPLEIFLLDIKQSYHEADRAPLIR